MQALSRQLQALFTHHKGCTSKLRLLGINEKLKPSDNHTLSRDVALGLSNTPLGAAHVVFAEFAISSPAQRSGANRTTVLVCNWPAIGPKLSQKLIVFEITVNNFSEQIRISVARHRRATGSFEAQAAYLGRLGLFISGECARLRRADFMPEIISARA